MPTKKKKSKKSKKTKITAAKKGKKKAAKVVKRKGAKKKKPRTPPARSRGRAATAEIASYDRRGLGADSGGQSGDTQGLSAAAQGDSESVTELLEEGQSYEAEVVRGVENAPDPDEAEVHTREVPEDDVPEEYREGDQ